jgi:hypothetical protein
MSNEIDSQALHPFLHGKPQDRGFATRKGAAG